MNSLKRSSSRPSFSIPVETDAAARHVRLCADVSRFLSRLLTRVPWSMLRYADRRRLDRALAQLGNTISLTRSTLAATESVTHARS